MTAECIQRRTLPFVLAGKTYPQHAARNQVALNAEDESGIQANIEGAITGRSLASMTGSPIVSAGLVGLAPAY